MIKDAIIDGNLLGGLNKLQKCVPGK